jgi:RNA polymerase sigma-70 factor (ECF subfamily)
MVVEPTGVLSIWQETGRVVGGTDEFATLETVVREHSRFVFKVAHGVVHNSHDAEDVVQEVFLRVHRSKTSGVADMRAWLARIAFRLALDRLRKPPGINLEELEMPSGDPDAERLAIHRQGLERTRKLIAALPEELRYPLLLSALEELNSRQIGEVLGIPESSVRGRIFRARHLLKEKLAAVTEGKS